MWTIQPPSYAELCVGVACVCARLSSFKKSLESYHGTLLCFAMRKKKTVANFNRNEDLICILFWSVGQDRFAFFLFFSSCSSLLIATLLSRLIIVFVQWIGLGIFWWQTETCTQLILQGEKHISKPFINDILSPNSKLLPTFDWLLKRPWSLAGSHHVVCDVICMRIHFFKSTTYIIISWLISPLTSD